MAVEFLSAAALYRHLVEHANAKPIVLADDPWSEAEGSWWQLSREEAAAFLIDVRLRNALMFAWVRYQDFVGISEQEFAPFRSAERLQFADCFEGERVVSTVKAARFMSQSCSLPLWDCMAWAMRAMVQDQRSGFVDPDPVQAPAWAFGTIENGMPL